MIRGNHLTHVVMGAIEVAANGDFANWRVPGESVPGVGGAMDLAVGVRDIFNLRESFKWLEMAANPNPKRRFAR